MNIGPGEILIVLAVALIVLGPDKLPNAARQAGKAFSEFKRFSGAARNEFEQATQPTKPKSAEPVAYEPPTSKQPPDSDSLPESNPSHESKRDTSGFELIDSGKASFRSDEELPEETTESEPTEPKPNDPTS